MSTVIRAASLLVLLSATASAESVVMAAIDLEKSGVACCNRSEKSISGDTVEKRCDDTECTYTFTWTGETVVGEQLNELVDLERRFPSLMVRAGIEQVAPDVPVAHLGPIVLRYGPSVVKDAYGKTYLVEVVSVPRLTAQLMRRDGKLAREILEREAATEKQKRIDAENAIRAAPLKASRERESAITGAIGFVGVGALAAAIVGLAYVFIAPARDVELRVGFPPGRP